MYLVATDRSFSFRFRTSFMYTTIPVMGKNAFVLCEPNLVNTFNFQEVNLKRELGSCFLRK